MPKTFDDAQEGSGSEQKQGPVDTPNEFNITTPKMFGGQDLESAYKTIATFLELPNTSENRSAKQGSNNRYRQRSDQIRIDLSNQTGIDFGSIASALQNLTSQDLSNASTNAILTNIAGTLHIATSYMQVQSEAQINQLSALASIMQAVQAPSSITVSGSNAINKTDEAEAVIPQSKSQSIPTRTLFIRADPDNTDDLYFGDDTIQPDNGWMLHPGESIIIDFDLRDSVLYYASSTTGQAVDLIGVF